MIAYAVINITTMRLRSRRPPTHGFIYFLLGYFKYINMIFFYKYYIIFWSVWLVIFFKQEFVTCFFFSLYIFCLFHLCFFKMMCSLVYLHIQVSINVVILRKKITLVEHHTLWGHLGMWNDSNRYVFVLARKCTCL